MLWKVWSRTGRKGLREMEENCDTDRDPAMREKGESVFFFNNNSFHEVGSERKRRNEKRSGGQSECSEGSERWRIRQGDPSIEFTSCVHEARNAWNTILRGGSAKVCSSCLFVERFRIRLRSLTRLPNTVTRNRISRAVDCRAWTCPSSPCRLLIYFY